MTINKAKISEIADVEAGFAWKSEKFSDNSKDGLPIIRIQNLGGNENAKFVYYKGKYEERYIVNSEDLLVSLSGSFKIFRWDGPRALLNQRIVKIIPKENLISKDYLYYYISNKLVEIQRRAQGIAVANASMGTVRNMQIPFPPLSEQKRIVEILEKVDALREKRREADELNNKIIQSVFLEMFGDPLKNPKGWPLKKIGEVCLVESGGTPSTKEEKYWKNGTIPWLGSTACKDNFINEPTKHITEEGLRTSAAKLFKEKTVLVALVGATIGKTGFLTFPSTTNQNVAGIYPLEKKILLSEYLFFAMQSLYSRFITLGSDSFKMANLSFVKKLEIAIPDLQKQQKFADLVQKVEKVKEKQQESKQELDNLFNALIQKIFKGESE